MRDGHGTYISSEGREIYAGWYRQGKRHGQGVQTFSDGRKYVGEWKDGMRDGQGTFTFPDGYRFSGEWKKDVRWNGTVFDINGEIVGKILEGAEL